MVLSDINSLRVTRLSLEIAWIISDSESHGQEIFAKYPVPELILVKVIWKDFCAAYAYFVIAFKNLITTCPHQPDIIYLLNFGQPCQFVWWKVV